MITFALILFLVLLFVGDMVILFKVIDEWQKKIENMQGSKRNVWLVAFYIISTLLIILAVLYWW